MSATFDTLVTAGVAVFGSASVYAGVRLRDRSHRGLENRKVTISEFELFKESYYEQIAEFKDRYAVQEAKMKQVERLLRLALGHILDLRTDMRRKQVIPSHSTPPELESLLWSMTDEEAAAGGVPQPVVPQGE